MNEPGFVDRVVEWLARAFDALGWNGTRLRWRWNQRRRNLAESGARATILWRSASAPHKMCPACRALVPRAAARCSECGAGLASVRGPGLGRLIANVLPGATTATSLILLVNGALFALMLMASISDGQPKGLLAAFDVATLVRFGANFEVAATGEWWRLVTPIFLHGGLLHFAFNSYALIQLGPMVEEEYGTERFVVVYVCAGIVGSMASQVVGNRVGVGASGAICGLIGLLLAYGMRRGGGAALRESMTRSAVYILIFSFLPGIDLLAHLGGFASGFALGWVVRPGPFRSRGAAATWNALVLGTVLLVLWSFWQVARHGVEAARGLAP